MRIDGYGDEVVSGRNQTRVAPAGAALLVTFTSALYAADDAPALPDPTMTPGAIDRRVTLSDICNGTTRSRRPRTTVLCNHVFAAYSISSTDRELYECDHDVPVALGGASTAANLWPQPLDQAHRKDRLEVEMQRRACVAYRTLVPAEAAAVLAQEQIEIAEDWPTAYARYVLQTLPAQAALVAAPSMTNRLMSKVKRLFRSWIFGSQ